MPLQPCITSFVCQQFKLFKPFKLFKRFGSEFVTPHSAIELSLFGPGDPENTLGGIAVLDLVRVQFDDPVVDVGRQIL